MPKPDMLPGWPHQLPHAFYHHSIQQQQQQQQPTGLPRQDIRQKRQPASAPLTCKQPRPFLNFNVDLNGAIGRSEKRAAFRVAVASPATRISSFVFASGRVDVEIVNERIGHAEHETEHVGRDADAFTKLSETHGQSMSAIKL